MAAGDKALLEIAVVKEYESTLNDTAEKFRELVDLQAKMKKLGLPTDDVQKTLRAMAGLAGKTSDAERAARGFSGQLTQIGDAGRKFAQQFATESGFGEMGALGKLGMGLLAGGGIVGAIGLVGAFLGQVVSQGIQLGRVTNQTVFGLQRGAQDIAQNLKTIEAASRAGIPYGYDVVKMGQVMLAYGQASGATIGQIGAAAGPIAAASSAYQVDPVLLATVMGRVMQYARGPIDQVLNQTFGARLSAGAFGARTEEYLATMTGSLQQLAQQNPFNTDNFTNALNAITLIAGRGQYYQSTQGMQAMLAANQALTAAGQGFQDPALVAWKVQAGIPRGAILGGLRYGPGGVDYNQMAINYALRTAGAATMTPEGGPANEKLFLLLQRAMGFEAGRSWYQYLSQRGTSAPLSAADMAAIGKQMTQDADKSWRQTDAGRIAAIEAEVSATEQDIFHVLDRNLPGILNGILSLVQDVESIMRHFGVDTSTPNVSTMLAPGSNWDRVFPGYGDKISGWGGFGHGGPPNVMYSLGNIARGIVGAERSAEGSYNTIDGGHYGYFQMTPNLAIASIRAAKGGPEFLSRFGLTERGTANQSFAQFYLHSLTAQMLSFQGAVNNWVKANGMIDSQEQLLKFLADWNTMNPTAALRDPRHYYEWGWTDKAGKFHADKTGDTFQDYIDRAISAMEGTHASGPASATIVHGNKKILITVSDASGSVHPSNRSRGTKGPSH